MIKAMQNPPLNARESTLSDLEPLELVRSHMPKWLLEATPEVIAALNTAMSQSRSYHARVGQKFSELEGVEAFCAPLLLAALKRQFGWELDIFRDQLKVVHTHLITDDTLLVTIRHYSTYDEPKTLLWAALQNFSAQEAVSSGFNPQSHIHMAGLPNYPCPIRPHQFAAMTRTLDLGRKYQEYLQRFLGVAATGEINPTAMQLETASNLRLLKGYDMEVDAHTAYLKKNINNSAYAALLKLLAEHIDSPSQTSVTLDGKLILQSAISILDTLIEGIIVFSADDLLLNPGNRLIVYIPNDPVAPFFEFSSLHEFTDELKGRLQRAEYATFFSRFVALSARAAFMQKVSEKPERLSLTSKPLGMSAGHYLCSVQLKNMFADAQMLAVPTGVLDARNREEQWKLYESAGLFLVNVAALFVPVLGELMLAAAVGQMLSEVFEGVDDWAHGDIDHARQHLLNVATDIVSTAAVVVGAAVIKKAASGLSSVTQQFFEGFQPVKLDDGTARLWNKELGHYEHQSTGEYTHASDQQGFFSVNGKQHVTVDGKHYPVEMDQALKQWRIVHPRRATAFKPGLLHNQQGAWQLAHEHPLEWQGSKTLVGRLSAAAATLDEQTLERVRLLTNTEPEVMRQVHLDSLAPPPLLKVSLRRFEIDREISTFIEQMNNDQYSGAHLVELQLLLLPSLSGWPAEKGLLLLDDHADALLSTPNAIKITSEVRKQGKVLETVLANLSQEQLKALLGSRTPLSPLPIFALAEKLSTYASNNRSSVFERLYARFNVSSSGEALPIEKVFSGLPRTVTQLIVDSASDVQRDRLRTAKVPFELAVQAREYLHDARLNRAFEGFYLETQANNDTELLIRHFLTKLPNWPSTAAFELREGSAQGKVLHHWGNARLATTRVIVKLDQGYQRYSTRGRTNVAEVYPESSLSTAIFNSLTGTERQALGFAQPEQEISFKSAIATLAIHDRPASAQVLGMQPVNPGFKAPTRMTSGQLGYPLCGLDAGRYSSSIQRRVRDLYPEFSDEHVHAYLESVTDSGLEPLTFLRGRKRERRVLRETLQAWIDDARKQNYPIQPSSNYDYMESRYQAAKLIERSWRNNPAHMPWINPNRVFSLSLDGLRVAKLPTFPTNVDFTHIGELNLNNMDCRETADDFLAQFTGLVSLQMDNNRMDHLPAQLQQMPKLRSVSMARNLLYLTADDVSILSSLSTLEMLNLNDNLLGALLDLRNLPALRRVYLRRTWIAVWPEGLVSRPLLELADLRENQIVDIPELVYQAPASVTRNISLPGNPLSPASRLRLARYALQGGSSMGINSEQLMSEAAAFEFWTAGITSHELNRRELLWNTLRTDSASDDFFTVLSRLTASADAQRVRQDLSRRVWEMIEVANENETLRRVLMDVAAAPRSCIDSVAIVFSEMEVQMELAKLTSDKPPQESELLKLGTKLFRLEQVSKIAAEDFAARLVEGGQAPDELEILLAYRIGLADALELPGQPKSMTFTVLAGVTQANLDTAKARVDVIEKTAALSEFVSTAEFWRNYLISKSPDEFSGLTSPYFEQLNELLRKSPDMNSARYLRRVAEIRNQMDAAIDAWALTKTSTRFPAPLPH